MTTEDDFQRMLDANPADHATRLVLADWLQDRDDPRAEGYRALGEMRRDCYREAEWKCVQADACPFWFHAVGAGVNLCTYGCWWLPAAWFKAMECRGKTELYCPSWALCKDATRRELEDAAALAWGRLSDEDRERCRAELLQEASK